MDPELLALISRLSDSTEPLTDEELTRVEEAITAIAAAIIPAEATEDDIVVLSEARDTLVRVREVQTERAEAAADRASRAAELLAGITPEPPAEEVAPEETPAAEVVEDVPAAEIVEIVPAVEEAPADEQLPVAAAAAADPPRLPTISRLAHRRAPERRPVVASTEQAHRGAVLVASGDIPGIQAGDEVTPQTWAQGVMRKWDAIRHAAPGAGEDKIYMGTIERNWPEERILSPTDDLANDAKINAVVGRDALVASGGICGPVGVDYTMSTIAQAARPVRDSLAQFAATRGGIRYALPHTLAAVTTDAPAGLWTAANDVALNSPSTKARATFACQSVQEVLVDAITQQVKFGNFAYRFFPEQITQYMETVDAVTARLAEATLLATITTGSTAVTAGNYTVGAARELLSIIDRGTEAMSYRHRMAENTPIRVIMPEFLQGMIREDLAKNLPGDSGGQSERLAIANREMLNWFAVRNINVTWSQDSPTGAATLQGFPAQFAGDLLAWPSTTVIWMFPEGTWLFLDGGTLDLGLIRDSTLISTNDLIMFQEVWEKAVMRGHESLAITCKIAPTGASIGTEAPTSVTPTLGS